MTTLENFVSPALMRALGWTLVHSLWQGALVAAVLAGALLLLRRQRAEVRYAASAGALGVVVALAGITFGLYFNSAGGTGTAPGSSIVETQLVTPQPHAGSQHARASQEAVLLTTAKATHSRPAAATAEEAVPAASLASQSVLRPLLGSLLRYFDTHLPLLVVAWLLGLLAMSLRMLGGLLYVQRLRHYRVRPLPAAWQERLAALAARSGVRRPVALLESALVHVPLVVGHLRPMILLPLGTVAGLSPACLEAILAHELAHVLRRDYLVNLLQTVAEVLFFYHPAVWFVANCVRTERENCCDDTATALVGGDPLRLARALTALAEWSQSAVVPTAPRLALAAIGKQNALLNRIRRLVVRRPAAPTLAEGIMAGALVLGGLGLLGGSVALAGPLAKAVLPATKNRVASAMRMDAKTEAATRPFTAVAPVGLMRELPLLPQNPTNPAGSATVAGDTLPNQPGLRGRRQNGPGEVVITRDKKGRITGLVVNGQPVAVPKEKLTKQERRAGQQVTVVPVPSTSRRSGYNYSQRELERASREINQAGREIDAQSRDTERAGRELDKAGRKLDKMGREMDKAAEKMERKNGSYSSNTRRRTSQNDSNIEIDIDENALGDLITNALKLGNVGLNIGLQAASQGIDEARRSLEETLRDPSLSAEARRATRDALAELRREQGRPAPRNGDLSAAERAQEARERATEQAQGARERAQEARERAQEARERRRELEEHIRESQQELRNLEQEQTDRGRNHNEALVDAMLKDGLLKDKDHYQIKLTARNLVVDGKEQPQKVFQKYLKLYESTTGRQLTGNNTLMMTRNSDSSTVMGGVPAPPRPPRAPRAPLAPSAMPAPPAPPAAPRLDTEGLRAELRKDGIIGANEKDMQFQLNGASLTVNGKKQSDELAAKYRKLTGHDDGKNFNVMISTQE